MVLFTDQADVSVRPAIVSDAEFYAKVQLAAWGLSHREALGQEILDQFDEAAIAAQWQTAISTPPGAQFALFTALAKDQVVGFAAVSPGTIVALEVAPRFQRQGHGSRLLSASVDRLRRDGAEAVSTWILTTNEPRKSFFGSAGLGPDARVRTLGITSDHTAQEERWSAAF
ncbi:GNAT family N-acetyltransferase [Jonesiaceae bacterium BS-20]|uniref:GNAT family N-acetyltransferase n=1 Tax=Jonesiaceae bacterium BS-20 TaxID=3120821 RepID=A0AAU7DXT2_9MICO